MKLTRTTQTLRRLGPLRLGLVIGTLMLGVIAAGCSSSSPDSSVAAIDDSTPTTTTSGNASEDAASDDPQQAALDWAACMRKNGVDVPDPEVGSDGRVTVQRGAGRGVDDIDPETFQAAQKKCGSPFGAGGGPQLSDADREEMQATMLEFAACMRQNGVDMPDPDFSGGGGLFRAGGPGAGRIDPEDPTFTKAQEACQSILQDIRPGGQGGPGAQTSESSS